VAKGWRDTLANPQAAITALKKQSPLVDEALELEKLRWLIKNQIVTAESRADGLGAVRKDRMEKSVSLLTKAFQLSGTPVAADVITDAFLPAADVRKLP
jgi:NitT/TauT family transport system substrate-binding protein